MEYNTSSPIYLQVIDMIKKQLVLGELQPGDQLPSTRVLAVEYDVNPNTAARIYKEMELAGLCYTKRGLGTYLSDSKDMIKEVRTDMANHVIDSFIDEMTSLGYTFEEMVHIINEREIIHNDNIKNI
ncbi:MAG: GntR family transcriptional regulator [Vallitaleaceae bacterium]|jgi:GntR family transcriptional regulator|nr:GntR family transcriptional regulator [Vallitaleaceae bacterium]